MVMTFILLYALAGAIYLYNREKNWAKWIGLLCFSFGSGAFGKSLVETFFPYLEQHGLVSDSSEYLFQIAYSIGSFLNQSVSPYCFIMFALSYSGYYSHKFVRMTGLLLLIPVIVLVQQTTFSPKVEHNYYLLLIWALASYIPGIVILIYRTVNEQNKALKKESSLINLLLIPPVLANIVTNYVGHAVGLTSMWRLNAVSVVLVAIVFISLVTRYGVLGIRLKIEKQAFDNTMKAVASGSVILNHTMKNEFGKILILSERIKYDAGQHELAMIIKDADNILNSTHHMLEMVDRIQKQSQEILLKLANYDIREIIESSIKMSSPLLVDKLIRISVDINSKIEVNCDNVHLQEVFANIIQNAIEAIGNEGILKISAYVTGKTVVIEIKDSGQGIKQEYIAQIFKPYFTTKNHSMNFGLGLSYCMNVLQQLNGQLDVHSRQGEGTTFIMSLPYNSLKS